MSLDANRLASRMLAAVMPMNTTAMSVPMTALTSPSVPAKMKPSVPLTTSTTAASTPPQASALRSTGFEEGVRSADSGRASVIVLQFGVTRF